MRLCSETHGVLTRFHLPRHADVAVPLNRPVMSGDCLFVTLHTDKGTRGRFEFDAATGFVDDPFVVGGVPVIAKFSVK